MRFVALLLALGLIACTGAQQSEEATETHSEPAPVAESHEDAVAQPEATAVEYAVGDKVELTGVAGCGHCSYHLTDSCSMAMQVGDVVYLLDGIDEDTEAFNQRTSGQSITVVGTLSDAGDPKHVQVESYQI